MASRLEGLLALRTLIDDAEHYPERLDSRASFAFGHAFLHDFFEGGHDARLELRGVVHQRAETAARLAREVLHRLRLQAPGLRELLRREVGDPSARGHQVADDLDALLGDASIRALLRVLPGRHRLSASPG